VFLTAANTHCPQAATALPVSPVVMRFAKVDGWIDQAPPGSFG
jgi:hypothetical protein